MAELTSFGRVGSESRYVGKKWRGAGGSVSLKAAHEIRPGRPYPGSARGGGHWFTQETAGWAGLCCDRPTDTEVHAHLAGQSGNRASRSRARHCPGVVVGGVRT